MLLPCALVWRRPLSGRRFIIAQYTLLLSFRTWHYTSSGSQLPEQEPFIERLASGTWRLKRKLRHSLYSQGVYLKNCSTLFPTIFWHSSPATTSLGESKNLQNYGVVGEFQPHRPQCTWEVHTRMRVPGAQSLQVRSISIRDSITLDTGHAPCPVIYKSGLILRNLQVPLYLCVKADNANPNTVDRS